MTLAQSNITQGTTLTAAMDPVYTAPALTRVRIVNATVTNETGAPVALSVKVFTGTNISTKIASRPIADDETYPCPELIGQILEPGAILKAQGLDLEIDVSAFLTV